MKLLLIAFIILGPGGAVPAMFGAAQRVMAQSQPLTVSTGVESGTYHRFFNEITQVCSNPPLVARPSKGSRENIDNLLGNIANLGIVQSDVLFARKIIDNDQEVDNIKTLMVLYPEEVHFITKSNNQYIHKFSDLGNKKVAAWGGSVITGWVVFARSGVRPIQFRDVPGPNEAMAMLDKGEIDAILAVGGQPLGWLRNATAPYKLVPFDRFEQVKDVYDAAVLSYSNLNQSGIKTITTQAILVTMNYRTKDKIAAVTALRQCITEKLEEIRETTGTHPKWRLVNPEFKGTWPFYENQIKPVTIQKKK